MNWTFLLGLILMLIGYWIWADGKRLAAHVIVAEKMMKEGLSESEAMEQSGCNFWNNPWYVRILKKYPRIPSEPAG